MNSTYKDRNLQLDGILLTQFEQGREVPALIESLAQRPGSLTIQERMMISRIVAAVGARCGKPVTVAIGSPSIALAAPILQFIFGAGKHLNCIPIDPRRAVRDSAFAEDLLAPLVSAGFAADAREAIGRTRNGKDFLVAALEHTDGNEIRAVIDQFEGGRSGLLLVRDYAMVHAATHYEYGRLKGLRLLELPDGSGELLSLPC